MKTDNKKTSHTSSSITKLFKLVAVGFLARKANAKIILNDELKVQKFISSHDLKIDLIKKIKETSDINSMRLNSTDGEITWQFSKSSYLALSNDLQDNSSLNDIWIHTDKNGGKIAVYHTGDKVNGRCCIRNLENLQVIIRDILQISSKRCKRLSIQKIQNTNDMIIFDLEESDGTNYLKIYLENFDFKRIMVNFTYPVEYFVYKTIEEQNIFPLSIYAYKKIPNSEFDSNKMMRMKLDGYKILVEYEKIFKNDKSKEEVLERKFCQHKFDLNINKFVFYCFLTFKVIDYGETGLQPYILRTYKYDDQVRQFFDIYQSNYSKSPLVSLKTAYNMEKSNTNDYFYLTYAMIDNSNPHNSIFGNCKIPYSSDFQKNIDEYDGCTIKKFNWKYGGEEKYRLYGLKVENSINGMVKIDLFNQNTKSFLSRFRSFSNSYFLNTSLFEYEFTKNFDLNLEDRKAFSRITYIKKVFEVIDFKGNEGKKVYIEHGYLFPALILFVKTRSFTPKKMINVTIQDNDDNKIISIDLEFKKQEWSKKETDQKVYNYKIPAYSQQTETYWSNPVACPGESLNILDLQTDKFKISLTPFFEKNFLSTKTYKRNSFIYGVSSLRIRSPTNIHKTAKLLTQNGKVTQLAIVEAIKEKNKIQFLSLPFFYNLQKYNIELVDFNISGDKTTFMIRSKVEGELWFIRFIDEAGKSDFQVRKVNYNGLNLNSFLWIGEAKYDLDKCFLNIQWKSEVKEGSSLVGKKEVLVIEFKDFSDGIFSRNVQINFVENFNLNFNPIMLGRFKLENRNSLRSLDLNIKSIFSFEKSGLMVQEHYDQSKKNHIQLKFDDSWYDSELNSFIPPGAKLFYIAKLKSYQKDKPKGDSTYALIYSQKSDLQIALIKNKKESEKITDIADYIKDFSMKRNTRNMISSIIFQQNNEEISPFMTLTNGIKIEEIKTEFSDFRSVTYIQQTALNERTLLDLFLGVENSGSLKLFYFESLVNLQEESIKRIEIFTTKEKGYPKLDNFVGIQDYDYITWQTNGTRESQTLDNTLLLFALCSPGQLIREEYIGYVMNELSGFGLVWQAVNLKSFKPLQLITDKSFEVSLNTYIQREGNIQNFDVNFDHIKSKLELMITFETRKLVLLSSTLIVKNDKNDIAIIQKDFRIEEFFVPISPLNQKCSTTQDFLICHQITLNGNKASSSYFSVFSKGDSSIEPFSGKGKAMAYRIDKFSREISHKGSFIVEDYEGNIISRIENNHIMVTNLTGEVRMMLNATDSMDDDQINELVLTMQGLDIGHTAKKEYSLKNLIKVRTGKTSFPTQYIKIGIVVFFAIFFLLFLYCLVKKLKKSDIIEREPSNSEFKDTIFGRMQNMMDEDDDDGSLYGEESYKSISVRSVNIGGMNLKTSKN